jgi:hypothetical protein
MPKAFVNFINYQAPNGLFSRRALWIVTPLRQSDLSFYATLTLRRSTVGYNWGWAAIH